MDEYEDRIGTLAQRRFGLRYLRPFQRLAITRILEHGRPSANPRRDQLIVLPTGSGKSVCFQLPALLLDGLTVVVYPLLALMNDQKNSLDRNGIPSVVLRGGQTKEQRSRIWREIASGTVRIVITNPETLVTGRTLARLATFPVDLFVVDEAHTVCQWGETFRPAYLGLGDAIDAIKPKQTIAFTATADNATIGRLTELLFRNRKPFVLRATPDRPNIHYHVRRTLCPEHDALMLLERSIARPVVIFCRTRIGCERLAWRIASCHPPYPVQYYHAGLSKTQREAIESWFRNSRDSILCATVAFGMGVDKPDIRTVIHTGMPDGVLSFLQESGRAGRDGDAADAWMLVDAGMRCEDSPLAKAFLSGTCIRKNLLALMDATIDHDFSCGGCDVCDGTSDTTPDGQRQIVSLIRRYPFRFCAEEAAWLLSGRRIQPVPRAQDRLDPAFGTLENWFQEHLVQAIDRLCALGFVKRIRRGPLAGRLLTVIPKTRFKRRRSTSRSAPAASVGRSSSRPSPPTTYAQEVSSLRNRLAADRCRLKRGDREEIDSTE